MNARRPSLVGIPYDEGSSFLRGAARAPALIREALRSPASNSWSEGGVDTGAPGALEDAGDLALPATPAEARVAIEAGIRALLRGGRSPIALGGDHSVTYPILRGVAPEYPGLTVLHFDAHPDLYDEFQGDRFSHACPFSRVMEEGLAGRLVQVGVRTVNAHQRAQAERFGAEVLDMRAWASGARPDLRGGPLYVSVDVDALDPAFAPGVSHREPGGLSVRELLSVLQAPSGPIVGADVVEFNPDQDPLGLTAPVCAKLVKELAGRMLAPETPAGRSP